MRLSTELRLFRLIVGVVVLIPLGLGPIGAFAGLEALGATLGGAETIRLDPSLRNHLRAICLFFAGFAALVAWALGSLEARAGAIRLALAVTLLAGLARLTGFFVDGRPGPVAIAFMTIELVVPPLVLLWHGRLLRRLRGAA